MTKDGNDEVDIWSHDHAEFSSLSHPGYAIHSDPDSHVGGWLAHRAAQQSPQYTSQNGAQDGAQDGPVEGSQDDAPFCWIRDEVAPQLTKYDYSSLPISRSPRILVLYGSLRPSSFSRKLAYEFARLLEALDCDVRTYNPRGLPVRDPALERHAKVTELRSLTHWSDGHVWVSPEMHGTVTGVFKNQIDWIPLNTGSIRPTQGKTCCIAQVNGGSQSFNVVTLLRNLARWMRMPCCTNQSSVPMAWKEFDDAHVHDETAVLLKGGRMKPSSYRDRVVDVAEEFAKFTAVMVPVSDHLTDRYSERKEKGLEGRLLTQAEKETRKTIAESRKG